MNTFWVYENIKKQWSFYNKLDVLLLLCSGALWKKHHPDHHTVLYCDEITSKLIDLIEGRHIWDEIRELPDNKHVDKSVFWASSKLQILRGIKEPAIVMDHDFLVYKNLGQYESLINLGHKSTDGLVYFFLMQGMTMSFCGNQFSSLPISCYFFSTGVGHD